MKLTTLCYIEKDDCYLMMHRVKKKNDVNQDKWIGVGGKFLPGETPEQCMLREAKEETGLTVTKYRYCGLLTFRSEGWEDEYIHLYTATEFEGDLTDCEEGVLEWVPKNRIEELPIWEGDKIFLKLLAENSPYFSLKLSYRGDELIETSLEFPMG